MSAVVDLAEPAWQKYRQMRLREVREPHLVDDPAWASKRMDAFNRFYRLMGGAHG